MAGRGQAEIIGAFFLIFAAHAQRRGVDDQASWHIVALLPGHGRKAEALGQGQVAAVGGRCRKDLAATAQTQPGGHGVGRAARAQQERVHVFQGHGRQRGQKAAHVGIFTAEVFAVPINGVGRPGQLRLLADPVQQGQQGYFVRNGHRTAPDAQQAHAVHKSGQAFRRHFPAQINGRNAQRLKTTVVQQRGKALGQGPADHAVELRGKKGGYVGHGRLGDDGDGQAGRVNARRRHVRIAYPGPPGKNAVPVGRDGRQNLPPGGVPARIRVC